MKTALKNGPKAVTHSENALAKQALENIARIEREAEQKKLEQLESLQTARAAILQRINELNHQLAQIDIAIVSVTGHATPIKAGRKPRRNLDDVRERLVRWMEGRKGQKFMAGELVREFTELQGTQVSMFLKPLIESGTFKIDVTEGARRTKYYVEG